MKKLIKDGETKNWKDIKKNQDNIAKLEKKISKQHEKMEININRVKNEVSKIIVDQKNVAGAQTQ